MSNSSRLSWLGPALALGLLGAGCNDNITCVFTTGCQGGSGAISGDPAALPSDGLWIVDGQPDVTDLFPPETGGHPGSTPVVLIFSESMNVDTLPGAFEIVPVFGGIPDVPLTNVGAALVGDGRVLILRPPELDEGDYLVRVAGEARATDLTGQRLKESPGAQLRNFTVIPSPPDEPAVLTTFPVDGSVSQSETGEIVVVFDRPVRANTVDDDSFVVKVDGADPVQDPPPLPLVVQGTSGPEQDRRVFLYRSADAQGVPSPLGLDALVDLTLSPLGSTILDDDNDVLPGTAISFRTLSLAAPVSGALMSQPTDAIGLANLTDGDPQELTIAVTLDAGEPGDALDLFIFGETKTVEPQLIALQRMISLAGTAPITSALFTREDVGLLLSDDPADTRVADGPIAFALRSRRGALTTPLRVLDVEPGEPGITDPILDTMAPTLAELLVPGGTTALFVSDQRGIALAGRASELVRSAEVTTPLGDNGPFPPPPPVIGSNERGLFLTSSIPAGVLATGTTTYTLTIFDAALNPSDPVSGTFEQVGVVGPGALAPGDMLTVDVFDERTLAPISGAFVLVHSDLGNGVDYPFHQFGQTGPDGSTTITTAGAPSVGAIVTVQRSDFDLFTFHGVPSSRLSVPLRRTGLASARASGEVTSTDAGVVALLDGLDLRIDDSRRSPDLPRGFEGGACGGVDTISCDYGPEPILPGRLGARTAFAGDLSLSGTSFSAALAVQAFAFSAPLGPSLAGVEEEADLEIPFLLTDARTPSEEAAQELPSATFRVDAMSGVDLGNLDDDPVTTGLPFITVETLVPGLGGAIAVGPGLGFDLGMNRWLVRSAQPGAVTLQGSLGSQGIVDMDPFVRMELRDQAGASAGTRPRRSTIQAMGPAAEFPALPVASVVAPAAGTNTGGQAFTIALSHAIDDGRGEDGFYRVELADVAGRGWTLWRLDPPGVGNVLVRVPDVADVGGLVGLADGMLSVRASAFAWAGLDPSLFLWSDVGREPDLFSFAAPIMVDKP